MAKGATGAKEAKEATGTTGSTGATKDTRATGAMGATVARRLQGLRRLLGLQKGAIDILKIAKISLNITTAAFSGTRLKGFSQNIA